MSRRKRGGMLNVWNQRPGGSVAGNLPPFNESHFRPYYGLGGAYSEYYHPEKAYRRCVGRENPWSNFLGAVHGLNPDVPLTDLAQDPVTKRKYQDYKIRENIFTQKEERIFAKANGTKFVRNPVCNIPYDQLRIFDINRRRRPRRAQKLKYYINTNQPQ